MRTTCCNIKEIFMLPRNVFGFRVIVKIKKKKREKFCFM